MDRAWRARDDEIQPSIEVGRTRPLAVLVVRHTETAWSKAGRHTGRTDIPLSNEGRNKAAELSVRLGAPTEARVLSSPLSRALETCSLAGFGDRVEVFEDLAEWDYGDYEGQTTTEIRAKRPGWQLFVDGCEAGERVEDVRRRVERVMATITAGDAFEKVIIFSHGHLLRVLTATWLRLPAVEGRHFVIDPGAIGELGYEREERALLRWNA